MIHTVKGFYMVNKAEVGIFAFWEICMPVKKQQLELNMEQQTGSKLGKEYVNAV